MNAPEVVAIVEEQYDYNHLLPEGSGPAVVASSASLYGNDDAIQAQKTGTSLNPAAVPKRAPAASPGGAPSLPPPRGSGGAPGLPPPRGGAGGGGRKPAAPPPVIASEGELYTDVDDGPGPPTSDLLYE